MFFFLLACHLCSIFFSNVTLSRESTVNIVSLCLPTSSQSFFPHLFWQVLLLLRFHQSKQQKKVLKPFWCCPNNNDLVDLCVKWNKWHVLIIEWRSNSKPSNDNPAVFKCGVCSTWTWWKRGSKCPYAPPKKSVSLGSISAYQNQLHEDELSHWFFHELGAQHCAIAIVYKYCLISNKSNDILYIRPKIDI